MGVSIIVKFDTIATEKIYAYIWVNHVLYRFRTFDRLLDKIDAFGMLSHRSP